LRLGDWAVLKVPAKPSDPLEEDVVQSGFFDERWLLRSAGSR